MAGQLSGIRVVVETAAGVWQAGELLLIENNGRDYHIRLDGEQRVDIWHPYRVEHSRFEES